MNIIKNENIIWLYKTSSEIEGVTQETRDCVNYIDAAVQHFANSGSGRDSILGVTMVLVL